MAEIEHFVDPTDKTHPKFENVSSQKLTLYPSEYQIEGKPAVNMALEDAVSQVILKYMKLWVSGPTWLPNTEVLFSNISCLY